MRTEPKPLIVVDSFRAFLNGDKNDASVVRSAMQSWRRLEAAGAGLVLLHHPGKGESSRDYRGSSDFKAAIDIGYSLTNLGERQLDRLRLKAWKSRFVVDADSILHYRDGQFSSDQRTNAVAKSVTEQLTQLLRDNAGIFTADFEKLADKKSLGRNRCREFVELGLREGEIRIEKGFKNTKRLYLSEDLEGLE